jgi:hypothetical protein
MSPARTAAKKNYSERKNRKRCCPLSSHESISGGLLPSAAIFIVEAPQIVSSTIKQNFASTFQRREAGVARAATG